MSNTPLEIEAKIPVTDLVPIQAHLITLRATLTAERVFESNIRYDDSTGSLSTTGRVLRLRQDSRARLTYKEPTQAFPSGDSGGINIRTELETTVSDFAITDQLLQKLGFRPVFIYEKYRTTYQWNDCEVVLDELPYGNFIEIEGALAEIEVVCKALGLSLEQAIHPSYTELFELARKQFNLTISHLTFEAFKGVTLPTDWLNQLGK
jgi:adenylate cyclase class 2